MMIELSPIDHAIELAQAGCRVMWIDEVKTHGAALEALAPYAVDVVRVNGRQRATFAGGGEVKFFSTSTNGHRGYAADVILATGYVLGKHWGDVLVSASHSRLALPGDVGPIYRLPERVA